MARIDIKSEREFLREIYKKVESGKYGIPVFQRDYVWTQSKIIDFFDSIWKGYPIGAVILWKPDAKMPTKDILTDEQQQDSHAEFYVLDGRQRLTTFYGCVQNRREREKKFELFFNLATEAFSFKQTNDVLNMKVADIYDTFSLLMKLQAITKSYEKEPQAAKQYIEKANRLNSILQGYTVSEIFIEDCSLDEAEEVFARINSKGTDISKEYKLQALTYKRGDRLVTDMISEMKRALAPYHFESIKSDTIIDCLYKFVGKNYYDAKVEDLCKMNFEEQFPLIKQCLIQSVDFLYNECNVLSEKILPYKNQLIALTWFFRNSEFLLDGKKRKELKKWFLYTTYRKSFNNSSLSNIRPMFNQFEDYIEMKVDAPISYLPVEFSDKFNFKFRHGDAHTDFAILAIINKRKKLSQDEDLGYKGYVRLESDLITDYVICLTDADKSLIEAVLFRNEDLSEDTLCKLSLTSSMVEAYRGNNLILFRNLRRQYLMELEKEFLVENDVEIVV